MPSLHRRPSPLKCTPGLSSYAGATIYLVQERNLYAVVCVVYRRYTVYVQQLDKSPTQPTLLWGGADIKSQ